MRIPCAQERRQQVEYMKMERKNVQQQAVLKRKGEEAAAANRRLKEALMKQKQVLADRNVKQERHDASNQARFKVSSVVHPYLFRTVLMAHCICL